AIPRRRDRRPALALLHAAPGEGRARAATSGLGLQAAALQFALDRRPEFLLVRWVKPRALHDLLAVGVEEAERRDAVDTVLFGQGVALEDQAVGVPLLVHVGLGIAALEATDAQDRHRPALELLVEF